jgi:ATP-dependent RNA helicase DHX8/PRP22
MLKDFVIYPLYAAMSAEEQLKAFAPASNGVRKFVLATNIAETSVTISGITYVIDAGYVKSRFYQASNGIIYLISLFNISNISI